MARRIKLTTTLSVAEVERRYRSASEGIERSHWHIIWLLLQGHTAGEAAGMTGYSAYWIGQIAKRFNEAGEEALLNHRQRSRPNPHALLATPEQLDELRTALAGPAPSNDVWNSRTVARWLSERTGRRVSVQTGWVYLRKLDYTLQLPRPRHVKAASAEEQAAFKKSC